jgi:hypothetical protein
MGLFSRKSAPSIPTADELEAFGRYSFSPMDASDRLLAEVSQIEPNYYGSASADPAQFCAELRTIAEEHGEWVALGASRLIASLISGDYENREFDAIRGISLDFLRAQGVTFGHMTGYEANWWGRHRSAGA